MEIMVPVIDCGVVQIQKDHVGKVIHLVSAQ